MDANTENIEYYKQMVDDLVQQNDNLREELNQTHAQIENFD